MSDTTGSQDAKLVESSVEQANNFPQHLILVACHAVYLQNSEFEPFDDRNWVLQNFQKGEPRFYIEHIRRGVELAAADPHSRLVFSGGQTRLEAGPISEAASYLALAGDFDWWGQADVRNRTVVEEFARDSFENLLFGICRFSECAGRFPETCSVVSWGFKRERFDMHRVAIRFPASRFVFEGVNDPIDLESSIAGEIRNGIDLFRADPYGVRCSDLPAGDSSLRLGDKRRARNPFNRQHDYASSCPDLGPLLTYAETEPFPGSLPWSSPRPAETTRQST